MSVFRKGLFMSGLGETIYIILSDEDEGSIYGAFRNKVDAEKEIKVMYENGFYGGLEVREEDLC